MRLSTQYELQNGMKEKTKIIEHTTIERILNSVNAAQYVGRKWKSGGYVCAFGVHVKLSQWVSKPLADSVTHQLHMWLVRLSTTCTMTTLHSRFFHSFSRFSSNICTANFATCYTMNITFIFWIWYYDLESISSKVTVFDGAIVTVTVTVIAIAIASVIAVAVAIRFSQILLVYVTFVSCSKSNVT